MTEKQKRELNDFITHHLTQGHKGVEGQCPGCGVYIKNGRAFFEFNIFHDREAMDLIMQTIGIDQKDMIELSKGRMLNGLKLKEEK